MSLKLSTGFRDSLMVTGSLKSAIDGGVIRIYDGVVPATADAALSGNVLLCTISLTSTGTGITMNTASSGGVLSKNPAEVWSGSIVVSSTATFYRFSPLTDDGSLSTTFKRIQGNIASVGADLNFSSTAFVIGNSKSISTFDLALPTS